MLICQLSFKTILRNMKTLCMRIEFKVLLIGRLIRQFVVN